MSTPDDKNGPDRGEIARWVHEVAAGGEPDTFHGKRRAKRFAEGMPLEVCLNPQNASPSWNATMHNVSETGLSFWTRRDIGCGATVYVREFSPDNPYPWLRARVRHRTQAVQGFLIGLVFLAEQG